MNSDKNNICNNITVANLDKCQDKDVKFIDNSLNYNFSLKNNKINRTNVKLVNFLNRTQFNQSNIYKHQFLYISDMSNHCIRKLDLVTAEVSTYAGLCGSPGFVDGQQKINRLNNPDGIGIDDDGNLYVFDKGNYYMRIIYAKNKEMKTIINGGCYQYLEEETDDNIFNYKKKFLICFRKWIKKNNSKENVDICNEHYSLCKNSSNFKHYIP